MTDVCEDAQFRCLLVVRAASAAAPHACCCRARPRSLHRVPTCSTTTSSAQCILALENVRNDNDSTKPQRVTPRNWKGVRALLAPSEKIQLGVIMQSSEGFVQSSRV
eukprot:446700-Amphidinium_carterae.1